MHIIENKNPKAQKTYCYASECNWNKATKQYDKPRIAVGHLVGEPPIFVPNKAFTRMLLSDKENPDATGEQTSLIIETVKAKYGDVQPAPISSIFQNPNVADYTKTAWAVFSGPSIVFGGITKRYANRQDAVKSIWRY